MKRGSTQRLDIPSGMEIASIAGSTIHTGVSIKLNRSRRSNRATEYPVGTIGSDLEQRNYIQYLVQRYHRAREAELSFGRRGPTRFSYAAIFTNIERRFGAPTYFVSQDRFGELVKYLQQRIDATILGKNNRARGIRNYASLEEFVAEHAQR
jgi:hypothetical protein